MRAIWLACALACALVSAAGAAPNIGRPTSGYVYFHRAGADMKAHNEAVGDCVSKASQMLAMSYPHIAEGIVGNLLEGKLQDHEGMLHLSANIENCMAVRGWEVVRLDDAEGAQLARKSQAEQSAALSAWVGAASPEGQVVRRFEPLTSRDLDVVGGGIDFGRPSLSVTAVIDQLPVMPAAKPAPEWIGHTPVDPTQAPGGQAVLVIRMTTVAPAQGQVTLGRLERGPDGVFVGGGDYVSVASPTKFMWKKGSFLERTYVVPVPPGKWQIMGAFPIGFCLGSPEFDVAPGEAVFVGNFSIGSQDSYVPDMSLDAAAAALRGTGLEGRLHPARYQNGVTFPCDAFGTTFLYSLAIPGARGAEEVGAPATP